LARVVAAVPGLRGRCILATGDMLGAERPGGGVQGGEVGEGPILMAKPFSLDDVRAALRRLE
jgi:hypothetical protein